MSYIVALQDALARSERALSNLTSSEAGMAEQDSPSSVRGSREDPTKCDGDKSDCKVLRIIGLPRDVTESEVWVLFSGCKGFKSASVQRGTPSGLCSQLEAFVFFTDHAECVAAAESRVGTRWQPYSYPVSYQLVDTFRGQLSAEQDPQSLRGISQMTSKDLGSKRSCSSRSSPATVHKVPIERARLMLHQALSSHKDYDINHTIEVARKSGVPEFELRIAEDRLRAIQWRVLSRRFAGARDRVLATQAQLQTSVGFCAGNAEPEKKANILRLALRAMRNIGLAESGEYKEASEILSGLILLGHSCPVVSHEGYPSSADDVNKLRIALGESLRRESKRLLSRLST